MNILRDLPPELQKQILEFATDGPGVPLLLVRKKPHKRDMQRNEWVFGKEDIFYIRLPDPRDGKINGMRFIDEKYPYFMVFNGIVDLAGYDETATKTKFLEMNTYDGIPDNMEWGNAFGDNLNFLDFMDDAVEDLERAVEDRSRFKRNGNGDQLLFANFPTFKSHVAIVLNIKDYS